MGELYKELCDYDTLDKALLSFDGSREMREEWLINLQDSLIWELYAPGNDPDTDRVVAAATANVLRRHALDTESVDEPKLRMIIAALGIELF